MKIKAFGAGVMLAMLHFTGSAQTLNIGLQEDPDMLDPALARTYVGRIVFTSMCDKLVDVDQKLNYVPQLATSWSYNQDNTVLTFKLRSDALFQDGTKFDAAAAKANLERDMTVKGSVRKGELTSIAKIDAPDPTTLVITLKHPDATLLAALSDRAGMMLSPATFKNPDPNAVANNPVCSGPYKFVQRVQNDRIVLEKFKQYYDAKDYHFDKLVFLPIPDSTVRLSNLRAGSLQIIERMNPSDIPQVKQDPSLKYYPVDGLGYFEIYFNVGNGPQAKATPFSDPRVRRALELSIDRNAINQVVGNGSYTPANQPFPPASPYHSDKFPVPARNIDEAKKLLKEAGYTTVKANFIFGNNTVANTEAQMIQAMASEAGIELTLQPTDYAAFLAQAAAGNFQIGLRGWSGRTDPDGNITSFLSCPQNGGGQNDGHYCNPQVDALLAKARTFNTVAERKPIYEQAYALVKQDEPQFYLYYQPWLFVTAKDITGFTPYPDGMIRLKGVALAK